MVHIWLSRPVRNLPIGVEITANLPIKYHQLRPPQTRFVDESNSPCRAYLAINIQRKYQGVQRSYVRSHLPQCLPSNS